MIEITDQRTYNATVMVFELGNWMMEKYPDIFKEFKNEFEKGWRSKPCDSKLGVDDVEKPETD